MSWFIILFISLPVWVVLSLALSGSPVELDQLGLMPASVFSFQQAFLSAVVSMFFGGLGALGFLGFSGAQRKLMEAVAILPTVFPSLFLILASLNFVEMFTEFPYGLAGIVFIHSFINIGLAAVLLARTIEQKLGPAIVWAWLSGVPKYKVLFQGVFKALKWDFTRIFFVIFLFSWCSFTVPYLVGELGVNTIEVLLFEQIKFYANWQGAAVLALLQMLIIWIIGFLFLKKDIQNPRGLDRKLSFLSMKAAVLIPLSIVFILLLGSLRHLWTGFEQFLKDQSLIVAVFHSALISLTLGVITSFLVGFISMLILWSWRPVVRKFFILYQSPSALIMGFIFIYFFGDAPFKILLTAFCIALLYLPFLYKLNLDSNFLSLKPYHTTAKLLGASPGLCFFKISLPLASSAICLASAIGGFWAVGDYALSALFLTATPSLPILVEQMISTYRFELANALVWINLGVGAIVFIIPLGVGHVFGHSFKS